MAILSMGDDYPPVPPDYFDLKMKVQELERENAELKKKLKDLTGKNYNEPYASDWHYLDRYR